MHGGVPHDGTKNKIELVIDVKEPPGDDFFRFEAEKPLMPGFYGKGHILVGRRLGKSFLDVAANNL